MNYLVGNIGLFYKFTIYNVFLEPLDFSKRVLKNNKTTKVIDLLPFIFLTG